MACGRRRGLDGGPGPALALAQPGWLLSFGQPRYDFDSVESTQAIARQLAEDGAPEGTLVVAAQQTAGRGRLGNSFFSPPGGLYASLVLRPSLPPREAPLIGLAAGLAVAEAVHARTGLRPVLKWPNDLLLEDRKLSGVLLEASSSGGTLRHAIQGIGVNVNVAAFPEELAGSATSLVLEGGEMPLEPLLAELLACFEARYHDLLASGPDATLASWRAWPNLLGSRVRIAEAQPWSGVAQDLADDGALLVRDEAGQLRRVVAGDVHLLQS